MSDDDMPNWLDSGLARLFADTNLTFASRYLPVLKVKMNNDLNPFLVKKGLQLVNH